MLSIKDFKHDVFTFLKNIQGIGQKTLPNALLF